MTDTLSRRITNLAMQIETERAAQGFLPGASVKTVLARMMALAELAQAVEQQLADAKESNREGLIRALAREQQVSAILLLMQPDITGPRPTAASTNVIPFRPRPQATPQHPTGGDAA